VDLFKAVILALPLAISALNLDPPTVCGAFGKEESEQLEVLKEDNSLPEETHSEEEPDLK
jgi:hypothetical protein